MPIARNVVFPQRTQDEVVDRKRLEGIIDTELQKNTQSQNEPTFVEIKFDRISPEGVDRHKDYILGSLIETYKKFGWQEIGVALQDGNKKIVLWFQ
ncbi:hypothetical protein HYW94_02320 [Candidatus Uhrbacteria bacterium]|nr:hypothetical protein [Candidatus Uhrbacteria bacterium]